jgi:hypothetical protein
MALEPAELRVLLEEKRLLDELVALVEVCDRRLPVAVLDATLRRVRLCDGAASWCREPSS